MVGDDDAVDVVECGLRGGLGPSIRTVGVAVVGSVLLLRDVGTTLVSRGLSGAPTTDDVTDNENTTNNMAVVVVLVVVVVVAVDRCLVTDRLYQPAVIQ